jgi:AcrR family transcriptional regulator
LRADAARNAERIVRAAWLAFAELGAEVSLEEIARRAGVGVATLYRRFPNKEELIKAILALRFAELVRPAIERAQAGDDPWHGMVSVLEAALVMASKEKCVLKAAPDIGVVAGELATLLFATLAELMGKAQLAGLVRADLEPDDLPRLVLMLISTTRLDDPPNEDWRRYLTLMLDAFRPPAASPLPPASPLRDFP